MRRLGVVAALAAMVALGACSHGSRVSPEEPRKGGEAVPGATPPTPAPGNPGQPGTPDATAVTPPAPPAKIRITIRSIPPKKAIVHWGKKNLGPTPVILERPRDSGPVDLVLRGQGFFPVHTRAYTVKNDVIVIKMVKLEDRMTLFGAKQEIPEESSPLDPSNAAPAPVAAPTP